MVYIDTLKTYIDTLFPSAGTLLDWVKHKQINAAIIDGLAYATNPPGTAIPMISTTVPDGFHAFDGSELSRADNPKLFDVWGTTFGAGNGTTTFNCPSIPAGTSLAQFGTSPEASINLTFGTKGGELMHTLTVAEMPAHKHTFATRGDRALDISSVAAIVETNQEDPGTWDAQMNNAGGGEKHNNMPPYFAMNYIFRLC